MNAGAGGVVGIQAASGSSAHGPYVDPNAGSRRVANGSVQHGPTPSWGDSRQSNNPHAPGHARNQQYRTGTSEGFVARTPVKQLGTLDRKQPESVVVHQRGGADRAEAQICRPLPGAGGGQMNLGKHGRPKKRPALAENAEQAEYGGGYEN